MSTVRHAVSSILKQFFPRQTYEWRVTHTKQVEIEEDVLNLLVDPRREAVDAGANRGRYTVELSRLASHVHAFEPDRALADRLMDVARSNVTVSNAALSDVDGDAALYVAHDENGKPEIANATLVSREPAAGTEVRWVRTTRLDNLADRDIGFVKIDVEGHEIEVLQGGRKLIERQLPVFLIEIEERHRPGALAMVLGLLAEFHYDGFYIHARQTHDIADFNRGLQDTALLDETLPRREMAYVNNFIFVPPTIDGAALRARIDAHFAGSKRRG